MIELRAGRLALDPEVVRRAAALYDAEVAFTDSEVGRLLAGLDELGLAERTIVVATSDHGEEFLDHGGFEHGHTLYAELTHVPLIVRAPGLAPGRVRAGSASRTWRRPCARWRGSSRSRGPAVATSSRCWRGPARATRCWRWATSGARRWPHGAPTG
jgi:hypothetical protein